MNLLKKVVRPDPVLLTTEHGWMVQDGLRSVFDLAEGIDRCDPLPYPVGTPLLARLERIGLL